MDGADAVMLSGETSVGNHPAKVVEAMSKIIEHVEAHSDVYNRDNAAPDLAVHNERFLSDSICFTAAKMAKRTQAVAIVTMTHSGYTAFKLASHRPKSQIYVFTDNMNILTTLNLVWGVSGFYYDKNISTDHTIAEIKAILKKSGHIKKNDFMINIASIPLGDKGKSNMIKLTQID